MHRVRLRNCLGRLGSDGTHAVATHTISVRSRHGVGIEVEPEVIDRIGRLQRKHELAVGSELLCLAEANEGDDLERLVESNIGI